MAALTITATGVIPVAAPTNSQVNVFENGIAGAAMTAGQVAAWDPVTSTYVLCDADHATAAIRSPRGIVVGPAVAAGQPCTIQTAGQLALGAALTKGLHYVPGATAGAINPSADQVTGWNIASLGQAISTTVLELHIADTKVQI